MPHYVHHVDMGFMPVKWFLVSLGYFFYFRRNSCITVSLCSLMKISTCLLLTAKRCTEDLCLLEELNSFELVATSGNVIMSNLYMEQGE